MKRSNSNNANNSNITNNTNNEVSQQKRNQKSISLTKDHNKFNKSLNENNYNTLFTFDQKNKEKENNNLFSELSDYEIESTSKNITESQRNTTKNTKPNTYTEQLESKIQEQAKRLSDLTKYKILCEKKIKELNPNEKIPISEESIKTQSKKNYNEDNESYNDNINNKYDILYNKYQKLKKSYNELSRYNSNRSSSTNESNFNIEKYKKLKEKYKKLKNENTKLIDLLQQETITTEEQKNIISLLQQTIDNEIIKNGTINKYITSNNLIDFAKLKSEAEEYRKELVLSQALVNSLKSEIEQYNKERENESINHKKKYSINLLSSNDTYDNNSIDDNNLLYANNKNDSLIDTINSQKKVISELLKKNSQLEKIVNDASYKLNEGININNDAKDRMKSIELEIENKKNEISKYEEKFTYFNEYISAIKSSLCQLQIFLKDYVKILNKMAKEDLNSHLTKNFSDNVFLLKNNINQILKIEKYDLDTENDLNIINCAINTLTIVNDEFINIYEKIFESDEESHEKLKNLQNEIDSTNHNLESQKENIDFISHQLNEKLKENLNIKQSNESLNERNMNLNFEISKLKKDINLINSDKNRLLDMIQIICKINNITDMKVSELISQGISLIENIGKLREEKNNIDKKLKSINQTKIVSNNNDNEIILNEHNNLNQLINEIERKIKENEIKFDELKKELNYLYNMYNSYSEKKCLYNTPLNTYNTNNPNLYIVKKSRPDNLNGINSNFTNLTTSISNSNNYNFTYGKNADNLEEQYKKYIDVHSYYEHNNNNNQNNCLNYSNGNNKVLYPVIQTTPH